MTLIFIGITLLFLLMTAFPFILSCFTPKPSEPASLVVHSQNKKDPRYFANSFEAIMENALKDNAPNENMLQLSKNENFVYAKDLPKSYDIVETVVVSHEPFTSNPNSVFTKEVYVKGDAVIQEKCQMRAIIAEHLILRDHCEIIRWADGKENTFVGKGCHLGVSCTSEKKLTLQDDCTFQKLYAPLIQIGQIKMDSAFYQDTISPDQIVEHEILRNVKKINDQEIVTQTIITKHNLEIGKNCVIYGHIKTTKEIIIQSGTIVYGNIIADQGVTLCEGCRIYGDVFSQTHIYVAQNCVIGQIGKIKSMIARETIQLCTGTLVYGFVGCEYGGRIVSPETMKLWTKKFDRR